jgi:hypothetical protein
MSGPLDIIKAINLAQHSSTSCVCERISFGINVFQTINDKL